MKLFKSLLVFVAFLLAIKVYAQDSINNFNIPITLKKGIYKTYEEFEKNAPFITDSFTVVKDIAYGISEDGRIDTFYNGYTFQCIDSTKKIKKVFCFFDGKDLYIDVSRGFLSFKYYSAVDCIGRFPFIELNSKKPITLLGLGWGMLVDEMISKKKRVFLYLNKKGELTQATNQSIWFLLKNDKDFVKEFNSEKESSVEVFKKYLQKMNERYPI